jgi:hypothetical protein
MIFNMAAAIFENGYTLPVLCFLDSARFSQPVHGIASLTGDKWPVHSFSLVLAAHAC